MSKHHNTRQALLDQASHLFVRQGYLGFSYQDLADALEIRKASIHYHFPSKEDLGRAVLDQYQAHFNSWCKELLKRPVAEQFPAYVGFFRQFLAQDAICPCGMASAEYLALPAEMHPILEGFIQNQKQTLAGMIRAAQAAGLLATRHDPEAQALVLGAALQGALQLARVQQDPRVYDQVMATCWQNLRT